MDIERRDTVREPLSAQELRQQTAWTVISAIGGGLLLIWAQWFFAAPLQAAVIGCRDDGVICRFTRFFCSC